MAAGGTSSNVQLGPGRLYVAPVGTAEPASASAALDVAFRAVGYTEDGSRFTTSVTGEDIEVAEELDPIRRVNTKRTNTLALSIAEATRRNLALAMNLGAAASNGAVGLEPPDLDEEIRVMFVWDSQDSPTDPGNIRWIFRQCYQSGEMELNRSKAPDKTLLPVTFTVEKPDAAKPFKVFPNASGLI